MNNNIMLQCYQIGNLGVFKKLCEEFINAYKIDTSVDTNAPRDFTHSSLMYDKIQEHINSANLVEATLKS